MYIRTNVAGRAIVSQNCLLSLTHLTVLCFPGERNQACRQVLALAWEYITLPSVNVQPLQV